jgi:ParB-like chromosome segregation protein Spo0J
MGRLRVNGPLDHDALMPRIRELRAHGLTQEAIAVRIGCAQTTVQKWLYAEKPDDERKDGRRRMPHDDGMQRRATS